MILTITNLHQKIVSTLYLILPVFSYFCWNCFSHLLRSLLKLQRQLEDYEISSEYLQSPIITFSCCFTMFTLPLFLHLCLIKQNVWVQKFNNVLYPLVVNINLYFLYNDRSDQRFIFVITHTLRFYHLTANLSIDVAC